ncbi:hypothetical protein ACKWTF_011465 [Chironomus riparius]
MSRKLISITDDVVDSESISKLKSWENDENPHVSKLLGKIGSKSDKILSMISQLEGNKKLDIFDTEKVSVDPKVSKIQHKAVGRKKTNDEIIDNAAMGSSGYPKERKTIEEQKREAAEREQKALEACQKGKRPEIVKFSNQINYPNEKNISLESLKLNDDDELKPQPASKTPSLILPQFHTKNFLNLIKPKTGITLKPKESSKQSTKKLDFDPREKQKLLDGMPVKVFKRGEQLFVKVNEKFDEQKSKKNQDEKQIPLCRRTIKVNVSQLNLLTPKKKFSTFDMTLGKPFGIQLGSHNILNDCKTMELKGSHALDVVIVAHGMSHIKHPANWSERDIDHILMMGAELYKATKDVHIDKLNSFTKGFTYKSNYMQVTMTEPIVIGRILTMTERSMDLYNGLQKFFSAYQQGIFETSNLTLYIMHEHIGFYVFDPRGRNEHCERNNKREAALMAFTSIMNVYHLILNLSGINTKAPFKISDVKVIQFMDKDYVLNEFTAVSGSNQKSCRNDEYEMLNEQIAYLQGNLSLNSAVFEDLRNRYGLASSIMAIIYSKIDPPISWCKSTLDRLLHFGYKLHMDCLEDPKVIRSLSLPEIPSKFYVGDTYCVQIALIAYVHHVLLTETRFVFDNPITAALIESLDSFRCLLLEVGNYSFALWRTEPANIYYFFDPYQKNVDGDIDYYCGMSTLFVYETIDHLCEHLIERLLKIPHADQTYLKIHGMKIIELRKLSKKEQRNKPIFKMANLKCIRPFTADDARNFLDVPSTVDSIVPLLTKAQQLKALEKTPEQPLYQKITNLNSPSLVCCKMTAYDEIMASVERKLSIIKQPEVIDKTMEIMREIHSEILHNIEMCDGVDDVDKCLAKKSARKVDSKIKEVNSWKKNSMTNVWTPCGEYIGNAEKVLLKTDLENLQQERDEILNQSDDEDSDECNDEMENETMTLSQERLIPSHFQIMPDKTQIVRGTKSLFKIPLDADVYDYENLSVIIGIAAILTSTKYSIATWSPETVDYILGCGQIMSGSIKLKHRMDFYTVSEHKLPKIHIKDKFYDLQMRAVANGEFDMLEKYLETLFNDIDRFLIVTTHGSLAVFYRKNFYYLFEYATCNMVGYRIKNDDYGSSCFLRFDNLHSLIRRIYANHFDVRDDEKFIIYRVMVNEIKNVDDAEQFPYIPFTQSQEKIIIDAFRHNRMIKREEMIKKLKENDAKMREEKERIKKYRTETGLDSIPSELTENDLEHIDFDESLLQSMNDDDYQLDLSAYNKSMTGNETFMSPLYQNWIQLNQFGYDDGRIKGTFGYKNRMQFVDNQLRECHFACIYAIMYAVHHPFEEMNYRSIDVILENGLRIFESIDVENYQKTMALYGMIVEAMTYDLRISEFIVKKMRGREKNLNEDRQEEDFEEKIRNEELKLLKEFFNKEKYGIIQAQNCSLVIVYEKSTKLYHIFDPYDSSDTNESKEGIENPLSSWSKHESIESILDYIKSQIMLPEEPKISFKIYHVLIASHKKLRKQGSTGYFLFNTSRSKKNVELKSCKFIELSDNEKIEWITKTCTVPWSRLETLNADGMKRYTKDTKWKEYDIEMDMKLYSLWGNVHPNMRIFKHYAGKQHLACSIVSLIMSNLYNIDEWDSVLLDSIVSYGHKYLVDAVRRMKDEKDQLEVDDLNGFCRIQNFGFDVKLELSIFGRLYDEDRSHFNLNRALDFVLRQQKMPGVILLCAGRSLAIGNIDNKNFFMYDCQSYGEPLFKQNQGTTYVLKCCCMKILLACIILTLNVQRHNVKFYLYSLNARLLSDDEMAKVKENEEQRAKSARFADSN